MISSIFKWNRIRGLTNYDPALEHRMLAEELREYQVALSPQSEADALGDILFVVVGSLYKLTGGRGDKVFAIMNAIQRANDYKGTVTDGGKIVKPRDFKGPEAEIRRILHED